jgi:hypothetical protein
MDTGEHWWQSGLQMIPFANRIAVGLALIFLGTGFDTPAQLASTKLEGLQIQADSIYRSGVSRDLDCSIGLKFTGEKADRAISMSPVKIIKAVDDTGMDLVRTNKHSFSASDWPPQPQKNPLWFWQIVGGLKAPAPNAKTIRHLEVEVVFFAPTAGTPVLTNFMAKPGAILHQATLDQYQVQIRYDRETNNPPPPGSLIIDNSPAGNTKGKTVLLKVDDPRHKLVSVAFQKADGGILPATCQSQTINGSHAEFIYAFQESPPRDLNLVVYCASPEASDKVRFSLENIRLPWVDLPAFVVSAENVHVFPRKGTNFSKGSLTLRFTGGQLTNALGIRNLWFSKIEDDSGQPVKTGWAGILWNWQFDALPPAMSDGRYVRKFVPLTFQSPAPNAIRILKGEAELVCPASTNDYVVTLKDFMVQAGKSFDLPLLKTNHVQLTCLGPVNYAAVRQEFAKTNFVLESGALLPNESPSTNFNSLQFSLDDPDGAVIPTWGNFVDAKGQPVLTTKVMTSGKFHVYHFNALPPPETQLQLYLAVPESLQRIPFKIEGIPLN